MAPPTLAAQTPLAPHTLATDGPVEPLKPATTVLPTASKEQPTTDASAETAQSLPAKATAKDQANVPLWARIYPVSQPPFEQQAKGHLQDVEPPHASDEFPESQATAEEIARRHKEVADLEATNATVPAFDAENSKGYEYAWALPWHDQRFKSKWFKQPHLPPHQHQDPAFRALKHPDPEAFLHKPGITVEKLSPRFGSVIKGPGIDLTKLSSDELDEVALFVTQRGVVAFENQDAFIHSGPDNLRKFGEHFSQVLHEHPVASEVQGHPKLLPIYHSDTHNLAKALYKQSYALSGWHTDITFEAQPPGITTLLLFDPPETGGDTGFVDTEELYRRLSPVLRSTLTQLSAEHNFFKLAGQQLLLDRPQKRSSVSHIHPAIRTHPVTGRQSVFVNENFVTRLIGVKKEESQALVGLLTDLAARALDAQVRVHWHKGTVTLWDNRRTQHRIIHDVIGRRHGVRLTPQAERPFYARTGYDEDLAKVDEEVA